MNGFGRESRGSNKLKKLVFVILVPFILIVLFYFIYKLFLVSPPLVEGMDAFRLLPAEKTISLTVKNASSFEVFITQGLKSIPLIQEKPEGSEKIFSITVRPKDLGLNEGKTVVTIKARSGLFRKADYTVDSLVDTIPPKLGVVRYPRRLKQGMGGLAILNASGADRLYVKLGRHTFKAYPFSDGDGAGKNGYLVLFPIPFDMKPGTVLYAIAEDKAGNRTVKTLPTRIVKNRFRSSSINLSDRFMNAVIYPLLNETENDDPVSSFKKVNEVWRARDAARLVDISRDSGPVKLWKGRFLQLKNSKVMASYGDGRVYSYKGKPISRSVHLGYDLASVEHTPVEAANSGVVRFAGEFGIYGNTIVIDHGLGLMSLYGHLSEIDVKEGQKVGKGEIIGRTGSTGLAGGDHLHFGILIQGIEVSPLYWWDPVWVKNNIENFTGGG
ncbi:murein DD-endopeptidase MepM [bacterium BMS3Bbin06]|nr:murein DD-endopeptidase MepM [bacterium BMS3Bbin06]